MMIESITSVSSTEACPPPLTGDASPEGQISEKASTTQPRLDAQGHFLPRTEEEQARYAHAVRVGMTRIAAIPNEPGEDDRDFFREVDANRPHRLLFEGVE